MTPGNDFIFKEQCPWLQPLVVVLNMCMVMAYLFLQRKLMILRLLDTPMD
jgi:hypothetical protein